MAFKKGSSKNKYFTWGGIFLAGVVLGDKFDLLEKIPVVNKFFGRGIA